MTGIVVPRRGRDGGAGGQRKEVDVKKECNVSGCDRPAKTRGMCNAHYKRWRKSGSPGPAEIRGMGRSDSYVAVHGRLRKTRGVPSLYVCSHCDERAADWSYDHTDPDERSMTHRGIVVRYSLDLERYNPMCRRCHNRFDCAHYRPPRTCSIELCDGPHWGLGLCRKHYGQHYRKRKTLQPA